MAKQNLLPLKYVQFLKYAGVGLVSNLFLYIVYLCLTYLGMAPKFAMTLLYGMGVLQTFVLNRRWTFQHDGPARAALFRYGLSYLAGYVINFVALLVLVDMQHWPHEAVQGVMIAVLAVILFLLQKFWVFAA